MALTLVGGGEVVSSEFLVGLCGSVLQILTISDQTMTSFSGTFIAVNISHVSSRIVLNVIITKEVVSAATLHGASILC